MDVDEPLSSLHTNGHRPDSKRGRLDDEEEPSISGNRSPAEKRPRARAVLPPDVIARIQSLQATFDANSLSLDQTAGWDDASKRILRITAAAQHLLESARSLADETAADLGDLAALDLSRAERAPGVDPTPNLQMRMMIVDRCQQRIRDAQTASSAQVTQLRTEMGSPWTTEEEQHHLWLQALRTEEDRLQDTLLKVLLVGFA